MPTLQLNVLVNILLLSLVAGLGTGLGGLIAVIRKPGRRSFGLLMGMTAGVMITLSFLELVNKSLELAGFLTATLGFSAGAFFMFFLDFFAPHMRFGEAEVREIEPAALAEDCPCSEPAGPVLAPAYVPGWQSRRKPLIGRILGIQKAIALGDKPWLKPRLKPRLIPGLKPHRNHITDRRLLKTGILLTIGISIHNLPEGIAVGAGFMHTPDFGIFIATAILLHNIPEGIATALPLCKSGMCRMDSFKAALFSGLTEPVGALLAALFLATFKGLIPFALAFAGGVMVFITLDELLPAAREHGHQHTTAIGIIFGAIFVFLLSGIFGV
jgi:ZIP family zinc transporter